ncbi:MspA family porin [Nocardia sp. NEAU-G5]|uniref:MspA family porin n=1 Tax=Nocardia albiluteola TaxID=2842303 RepID=A0ABS6AUU5_9NOCA|nr:MspA family porin [Nocardia albiluteola]MBU3061803.1 MspA family porin [Nocardia albiluteola]
MTGISTRSSRVAAIIVTVGVGLGFGSSGAANADTFIPLPDASITRTLGDGTVVHLSIVGESAKVSGSMGATPLHRNAWTTGRVVVDVSGPKASSASIEINPGYIVGCQVNIGSLGTGEGESGTAPASSTALLTGAIGDTETLTLGPGQAGANFILDIEQPDDYGQESHKKHTTVHGPHASVSWTDETFAVNGCGGYAQARLFAGVDVSTDNTESFSTIYGAPFTMG